MDKVVPFRPGQSIASDQERLFVEELASKIHEFVEAHGKVPDCAVIAMWADKPEEKSMGWAAGWHAPEKTSGKLEAYGVAIGVLTKSLSE